MLNVSRTFRLLRSCGPTGASLSEENATNYPFSGSPVTRDTQKTGARDFLIPIDLVAKITVS